MNDGLLVVDKPTGMTSHSVVGQCRRIVGQKRIGHSGTLDPGATGVLLVALGRSTRLIRFLEGLPKSYEGEVVLGTTTSTLDDEGEVTATFSMGDVVLDDVRKAAEEFRGDITQVPPMVSALKVGGKRLHQLAREGIEVERKPRSVTVHSIDIEATDEPNVFRLKASVSSGTYIRTLAADIGEALGGGAHLRRLRRTAIGNFGVGKAVEIDQLTADNWATQVVSSADLLGHLLKFVVEGESLDHVSHGRKLARSAVDLRGDGPWAVVNSNGELLAVYESHNSELIRAAVVVASQ